LPLTALALVLAFLLGTAPPAGAARPAPPATASGTTSAPAAANSSSEEEKHSKRETERGGLRRLDPGAEGIPATRRPLPPCLSAAADAGTAPPRIPATTAAPEAAEPPELPILHCVFRC
ncbi:hypothetical protein ACFU7T_02650, partial [Streptomyces sp. NPDC057555]